jgi:sulfur carrier protein
MQVMINGETETIDEKDLSISRLLAFKKVESPDMVSVQLNGRIVARQQYDQQLLAENDEIEFLYFMGGGGA